MKVYLDNGATTVVAEEVAKEIVDVMTKKFGNASSLYTPGKEAKELLENSRKIIAEKINAKPAEIIFTSGGTEADNLAIRGFVHANMSKGDHIITSSIEHHAVLAACEQLQKDGFEVTVLPVNEEGFVSLDDLKKAITEKTILVTIMHANNEIGTIQPIKEIGEFCKERGIAFHTDAVQTFTKVPIDVDAMNIDMLSLSAHKIHGPKGIGALFVRKGIKLNKMLFGGHQENEMRAGTENVAGVVGFAKATELTTKADIKHMQVLRDKLIDGLLKIPHTQLNGSRENRLCNNASIIFKYIEGEAMLMRLDAQGIYVSTGSACSSKELTPSHVLTAIGLPPEIAHGSIRFTLSKYTTQEEIDYVLNIVPTVVLALRKISPFSRGFD
ncbi:MAG: cysteine desulfurase NifS [bacterium]|nr:cysteine desulfurase NifS [bacterium]